MRSRLRSAFVLLCLVTLAASPAFAQTKAKAQNVPEIPYESVPNFLKLPPGLYLGEAHGRRDQFQGPHLRLHAQRQHAPVRVRQNGNYVREIGEGIYGFEFAHAVRVDPQDNIWAVDEGTNMVIKFNPEGRIVMVLGHRPEAVAGVVATPAGPTPPAEKYILGRPTDVGWDPQGNIFVSDGYVNHRVVKYDKNGRFLKQVGSERPGSEPSQFNTPHGIAVDAQGNVYVADRANHRMQVFDNNLVLKSDLRQHRRLLDGLHLARSASVPVHAPTPTPTATLRGSWEITGEIYKMELDGTILGKFGHASKELGGFQVVHMMDCRNPERDPRRGNRIAGGCRSSC